jgi:putative ABC transport system permease protein
VGRWRVVGTIAEVGGPAIAYTTPAGLGRFAGAGTATSLRIATNGDAAAVADRVEAALASAGTPVAETLTTSELRQALDEHVAIFIYTLVVLAALMATVGLLGLASTMSINVTERTREYGVMQAVGATPAVIRRLVLTEGTLAGTLGGIAAIALGLPLSMLIGDLLGRLSFDLPLPLQLSPTGLAAWLALAVGIRTMHGG